MKFVFSLIALALFSLTAFSQPPSSTQQTIRWAKGNPAADSSLIEGKEIKTITVDGVTIAVHASEQRIGSDRVYYDKAIIQLAVVNDSQTRIDISPDAVTLQEIKPQVRKLERETAEHLSKSMSRRANIAGALGQMGAGMQTTQTTSTGNTNGTVWGQGGNVTYSGTTSSTTTAPDVEARRKADAQAAILSSGALQSGEALRNVELKANTVFPGKVYGGILIFERDKKCEEVLVEITFGGRVIEFPFTWQRK